MFILRVYLHTSIIEVCKTRKNVYIRLQKCALRPNFKYEIIYDLKKMIISLINIPWNRS